MNRRSFVARVVAGLCATHVVAAKDIPNAEGSEEEILLVAGKPQCTGDGYIRIPQVRWVLPEGCTVLPLS
jgi:hypothetical protein